MGAVTTGVSSTDPRTRRTVALLRRALGELLHARTLGQVTVSELCRTAGVHRTTFYKHYVGVGDFARAAFAAELDEVMTDGTSAVAQDPLVVYRASMVQLLEHVAAHRQTFRALLGPGGDLTVQRAISDHLAARAREALEQADLGAPERRADASTLLGFAALGMVERWAMSEDDDADAAADVYCAVVRGWAGG